MRCLQNPLQESSYNGVKLQKCYLRTSLRCFDGEQEIPYGVGGGEGGDSSAPLRGGERDRETDLAGALDAPASTCSSALLVEAAPASRNALKGVCCIANDSNSCDTVAPICSR